MAVNIDRVRGKVFVLQETGDEYGTLRELGELDISQWNLVDETPFATDDCGNIFLMANDGGISFLDHETDARTALAKDWNAFAAGCRPQTEIELDKARVEKVWVDPDFAKKMGLKGH